MPRPKISSRRTLVGRKFGSHTRLGNWAKKIAFRPSKLCTGRSPIAGGKSPCHQVAACQNFLSTQGGNPTAPSCSNRDELRQAKFVIGTKWNKLGIDDSCKLLKRWWPGTESNRRRQPFQGCALPFFCCALRDLPSVDRQVIWNHSHSRLLPDRVLSRSQAISWTIVEESVF